MRKLPFVNLHNHTTKSIFDGIGYPKEYIDYVLETGGDAIAFTEHGNCNSFPHYYLHTEKVNKKGAKFKTIPGIEAYFIDSLPNWRLIKDKEDQEKKLKQRGDHHKKEVIASELTYEVEEESKATMFDPIKHRNHLVLLAKNDTGLKNLFTLVSKSYKDGFYRYPRMDFPLLKEHGQELVCLTGCMAGPFATRIFKMEHDGKSEKEIQDELLNLTDRFVDTFGEENFYYEIQFNKLEQQHKLNKYLIALSKKTGIKLVATNDSHYPRPELWKERELYRKLSPKFSSFIDDDCKLNLPVSVDELECELYPKSGNETFNAYKKYSKDYDFYDDDIITESIENAWHVAHDVIAEKVDIDRSVKLPAYGNDEFKQLAEMCIRALKRKGFHKNQEYVDRLKYELRIIRDKKFERYFLTLVKGLNEISKHMLVGTARGSGGGSLVNYLLDITQVDPIRFNLIFERFINPARCLHPQTLCLTEDGIKQIKDLSIKDKVLTGANRYKGISHIYKSTRKKLLKIKFNDTFIICSENHRWIVSRDNKIQEIFACDLKKTDKLLLKKED